MCAHTYVHFMCDVHSMCDICVNAAREREREEREREERERERAGEIERERAREREERERGRQRADWQHERARLAAVRRFVLQYIFFIFFLKSAR